MSLSETAVCFNVSDQWGQGRTVFGGMQGAMAVKAMRHVLGNDTPLRSLQITFLGPVAFGKITVEAAILRQGSSATHVHAKLSDGKTLRMIATGIFGVNRTSKLKDIPLAPPCSKSYQEAMVFPFTEGLMPTFLQHFEMRFAEGDFPLSGAKHPHSKAYIRHLDPHALTEAHLVALGDVAPPTALMSLTKFAPASSMNWQLELIQQPDALTDNQWFRYDLDALASDSGYSWQNTNYWDEKGRLVMITRQCFAVFG